MKIEEFTVIKNRQRPKQCYQYRNKIGKKKYEISTFNSGNTFLATIETLGLYGSYFSNFSEHFDSIDDCLNVFNANSEIPND